MHTYIYMYISLSLYLSLYVYIYIYIYIYISHTRVLSFARALTISDFVCDLISSTSISNSYTISIIIYSLV